MWIPGANAFGENIVDACSFHDGTYGTPCNNPGTGRSWLEDHRRSPKAPKNLVRDCLIHKGNTEHAALGGFHALPNGLRHFIGFPEAESDTSITVTHYHDGAEGEPTSAFDNFSNSTDVDHLVDQLELTGFHR
jgi:hypothetical protein